MATELIKIDEVKSILSSFPDTIGKNSNSVKKCNEAGQALLDTIEGEGMNETIDQAAADYLKKVNEMCIRDRLNIKNIFIVSILL